MPLDRRLREGLDQLAHGIEPDVEDRLEATLRQAGRRNLVQRSLPTLVATAALVMVVIVGPMTLNMWRGGGGDDPSPPTLALVGAFRVSVGSGDAAANESNLSGSWTIEFTASGFLIVRAPAGFTGTRTGYAYQIAGDELQTDLFGSDVCSSLLPGRYRWERTANTLTFFTIDEQCPGRAALFTGGTWQATGTE